MPSAGPCSKFLWGPNADGGRPPTAPLGTELDVGWSVDRVGRLSAVEFLREYVGPNKPVVLSGRADFRRHTWGSRQGGGQGDEPVFLQTALDMSQ